MAGSIYKKYMWLVSTVSRFGGLTYEEISRKWENCSLNEDGGELSKRTFRNWLIAVEKDMGVSIVCERVAPFKYKVEGADVRDDIMEWAMKAFSIGQMAADNKKLKDRILLEEIPSSDERLDVILSAMQHNHRIFIRYQAFDKEKVTEMELEPYAVKLNRKRWYLVGHSTDKDKEYLFGIDRIVEVTELKSKFKIPKDYKAAKRFEGLIGVWNNTGKAPVKVRLKITGYLRDYIATLPLHPSQVLAESGKDYQIYEYNLSPNYELEDALCGFGGCCEVLEPKSLRAAVREKGKIIAKIHR